MKAHVDADRCAGHGDCVMTCPAVFALTDGGYAEAVVSEIPSDTEELAVRAARECPEHAITVE